MTREEILSKEDWAELRYDICKSCENFRPGSGPVPNLCSKCGCTLVLKTKIKKAKCPVDKW
jgi:hypothetical protein